MSDIVWESGDSKGIYRVVCIRVASRLGDLRLMKGDQVVKSEQVRLSYSAVFGPDIDDVRHWNRMATQWSNDLDKENQ